MSPLTIILVGLITIIKSQTSQECTDEYECQQLPIQKAEITCSGLQSCTEAALTSPNTAGFIHCSGHEACADLRAKRPEGTIEATNIVYCSALEACMKAGISSKSLVCTGYSSCDNPEPEEIIEVKTNINCGGAMSCQNNAFSPGESMNCNGHSACNKANVTAGEQLNCNGITSCYDANLREQTEYISCAGGTACAQSVIRDTDQLRLQGYFAAMGAKISGINTIKAFGSQSLKNAKIDSEGLTELTIQLFGAMAGDGARVACRGGSTCNLECQGTGCAELSYECETGATCNIDPAECENNSGSDVSGVECPDITYSTDVINLESFKVEIDEDEDKLSGVFRKHINRKVASMTDIRCGTQNECTGDNLNSGQYDIYCTGKASCRNADVKTGINSEESAIYCDGENSCYSSTLYSELGSVNCNGEGACDSGGIAAELVYCYGYRSCAQANIAITGDSTSRKVYCGGELSCTVSTIQDAAYVTCAGNEACLEAIFAGEYEVDCDGDMSCKQTQVTAGRHIRCSGNYACFRAASIASLAITIKGQGGAMGATIYGDTVEALGYKSINDAIIDSAGRSKVTVKAYGYDSGDSAIFACKSGVECLLDCKGTGCSKLKYICVNGATCNIEPSGCESGKRDIVKGSTCPIIKDVATDEKADQIIELKQFTNEKIYDLMEEFIDDGNDMDIDELFVMAKNEIELDGLMNDEDVTMVVGLVVFVGAIFIIYMCYRFNSGKRGYEILQ